MLSPVAVPPDTQAQRPTVTLVLLALCALTYGWILSGQGASRAPVQAAVERLEATIRANPEARLSPQELEGLPDQWRLELSSVIDEGAAAVPEMSEAVASLRDHVHALPTWRLGWIPSMKSGHGWFTYMWVHDQWFHLVVNLTLLWFLGATLEVRGGPRVTAVAFVLSGVAGAWMHAAVYGASTVPLLGASASVLGLLGGLLTLQPTRTLPFALSPGPGSPRGSVRLEIPLAAIVCLWVGLEALLVAERGSAPLALPAHLAGLVAGGAVGWSARRRKRRP